MLRISDGAVANAQTAIMKAITKKKMKFYASFHLFYNAENVYLKSSESCTIGSKS